MAQLSYGSKGDDVRKMQQSLMDLGYDLGTSGADGRFGKATLAAVKKYQTDNGLKVDGIAGKNTLGSLYQTPGGTSATDNNSVPTDTGNGTNSQNNAPQTTQGTAPNTAPNYSTAPYNPQNDTAYQNALAALQQAQSNAPTYTNNYETQLNDIYNQIMNRGKFSYDLNADMLYQQYKDQYVNMGQMAMKDTMGQAAALTGGYGSTYGQAVGQQQYDAYLQKLNDIVPDLYGQAYDRWKGEGEDMLNQYSITANMANDEYGKYQDSLNNYWKNVSYLQDQENSAYNRGADAYYRGYDMERDREQTEYDRQIDERNYNDKQAAETKDYMLSLIQMGYKPTDAELKGAGITRAQADAILKYANSQKASGYKGTSSTKKKTDDTPKLNGKPINDFTGTSKENAIAYLSNYGISADGLMDKTLWQDQRVEYSRYGTAAKGAELPTYEDYLMDYVYSAIEKALGTKK